MILIKLALQAEDNTFSAAVNLVADHLTDESVQTRWTLSEAITYLNQSL